VPDVSVRSRKRNTYSAPAVSRGMPLPRRTESHERYDRVRPRTTFPNRHVLANERNRSPRSPDGTRPPSQTVNSGKLTRRLKNACRPPRPNLNSLALQLPIQTPRPIVQNPTPNTHRRQPPRATRSIGSRNGESSYRRRSSNLRSPCRFSPPRCRFARHRRSSTCRSTFAVAI
jgi:hypothetical protein